MPDPMSATSNVRQRTTASRYIRQLGRVIVSRNLLIALAVSSAICVIPLFAKAGDDAPGDKSSDVILLDNCEVEFEESTPVGTDGGVTSFQVLQEFNVKLGDRVKAKQVLGRMADGQLRAQLATSKAKADNDISIRLTEAEWKEAVLKLNRIERLGQRDRRYVAVEEDVRLQVDADVAKLRLDQARYDRLLAQLQVYELEAQIDARKIFAPHDGVVVELYKKPGTTVNAIEPIIHVVNPDLLRIIGHVNVDDYGRVTVGQKVQITPEPDSLPTPGNEPTWVLNGMISFIDKRVDPKTRTFTIHAAVKNEKEVLAAGLEVRMEIIAGKVRASTTLKPQTRTPAPALISAPQSRPSTPQPLADRARSLPAGARLGATSSTP